jgi:hypothetical protein
MSSEDKKQIPKLIREKTPNRVLKRHIEGKEIEGGRSHIRLAIDRDPFYGYTASDKGGMSSMSLAIDLITNDGNSIGLQYHMISSLISFDISGTIGFEANGHEIKIEGRNLRPIYEYLLEHRLVWIQAALSEWEEFDKDETVVESITITPLSETTP